ncbi:MAG: hypothetical protein KAQ92_03845 [Candidatus Aenigmarchaeota archaeon]|nr:hypothetical protein [Candidatus Aenigmarchaeota archaeon]
MSESIKKAVSGLIAMALVFVVVFVMGVTLSNWFKDSVDAYATVTDEQQSTPETCNSQNIKIINVKIQNNEYRNESSITVYIKNDGIDTATLTEAKAFNTLNSTPCILTISNTTIPVGKTILAINNNCGTIYFGNSSNKKFDYIIVTSTCSEDENKFGDSTSETATWLN